MHPPGCSTEDSRIKFPQPGDSRELRVSAGALSLKAFSAADSKVLFNIRNHPSVLRGMRAPEPINWPDHEEFVRNNLLGDCRQWLFLIEKSGESIGLTLLRNFTDHEAEIGVMLPDAIRRRREAYFAAHMMAWFGFDVLGLKRLISKVPSGNATALKFNLKCGFVEYRQPDETYHYLVMNEDHYRSDATHRKFRARWPVRINRSNVLYKS